MANEPTDSAAPPTPIPTVPTPESPGFSVAMLATGAGVASSASAVLSPNRQAELLLRQQRLADRRQRLLELEEIEREEELIRRELGGGSGSAS